MAKYIDADLFLKRLGLAPSDWCKGQTVKYALDNTPAADVPPVVRCHDCIHAVPLERNCELNTCRYMHCNLWRGDETKNVWHKYQRFYKDYSIVEHDDFCSYGERRKNNVQETEKEIHEVSDPH